MVTRLAAAAARSKWSRTLAKREAHGPTRTAPQALLAASDAGSAIRVGCVQVSSVQGGKVVTSPPIFKTIQFVSGLGSVIWRLRILHVCKRTHYVYKHASARLLWGAFANLLVLVWSPVNVCKHDGIEEAPVRLQT